MDAEPKPGGDDASQSSQSETNFAARLSAEQSEMLGKFLLAPVPRGEIAPEIRRATEKRRAWWIIVAVLIILLMSLFWLSVSSLVPVLNDWRLDHEHREVTGFVTNVSVSYVLRGHGSHYYQYDYTFKFTPDNSTSMMLQHSFTTNQRQDAEVWHAGDKVPVWYLPGNAAVARIKGTRLGDLPVFIAASIIFAFGCVLLWLVIRSRIRLKWMLANGLVGEFRIINVEPIRSKGQLVSVRVECERADDKTDAGRYRSELFRQPQNKMELAQNLKDTGRTVFGLYDPRERERGKNRRRLEIPETWFW